MSVLPDTVLEQIEFCESHLPVWTAAPTTIGLTAGMVGNLSGVTIAARQAYNAAQTARQASKAATTTLNTNARTMRGQVSDLVRQIKAFAELQANPGVVYAAAQIPPPAPPGPTPLPGKPEAFLVTLESDGSVTLSWTATDAAASSGAFFTVSRKLPGQGGFVGIGGAPGSTVETRRISFNDATLPASAASAGAQYIVQGFRGSRGGEPSDAVIVQFGQDGVTVTKADGDGLRMAA
jgi:hypothetical protein